MATQFNLPIVPLAVQGIGAGGYSAIDLRRYAGYGVQEGVIGQSDFKVVQRAGGAAMAVDVNAGEAVVQGDGVSRQGKYNVIMDAAATGANQIDLAAAHATLPRVDSIILEIKDNQIDASGVNRAQLRSLQGTATSGANISNRSGAAAVPSSALLIADIEVAAAVTTITTANIYDRRPRSLGAFVSLQRSTGVTLTGSPVNIDSAALYPRFECTGGLWRINFTSSVVNASAGVDDYLLVSPVIDGTATQTIIKRVIGNTQDGVSMTFLIQPAAGSRRLGLQVSRSGAATMSLVSGGTQPIIITWEEIVQQVGHNGLT